MTMLNSELGRRLNARPVAAPQPQARRACRARPTPPHLSSSLLQNALAASLMPSQNLPLKRGCSVRMLRHTRLSAGASGWAQSSKGKRPDSSWYAITPAANTSLAGSTAEDSTLGKIRVGTGRGKPLRERNVGGLCQTRQPRQSLQESPTDKAGAYLGSHVPAERRQGTRRGVCGWERSSAVACAADGWCDTRSRV